jgi:hypothetical protein
MKKFHIPHELIPRLDPILLRCCLFFILFLNAASLFPQAKTTKTLGLSAQFLNAFDKSDAGVTLGLFYKKFYSQFNIHYGFYIDPDSLDRYEIDRRLARSMGLGYTFRYFPNDPYTLFTSFLQCDLLFSQNSCTNEDGSLYTSSTAIRSDRKIFGAFIGYGIGINFMHHFTLMQSVGFGSSYRTGKDEFLRKGQTVIENYSWADTDFLLQFGLIFHPTRF